MRDTPGPWDEEVDCSLLSRVYHFFDGGDNLEPARHVVPGLFPLSFRLVWQHKVRAADVRRERRLAGGEVLDWLPKDARPRQDPFVARIDLHAKHPEDLKRSQDRGVEEELVRRGVYPGLIVFCNVHVAIDEPDFLEARPRAHCSCSRASDEDGVSNEGNVGLSLSAEDGCTSEVELAGIEDGQKARARLERAKIFRSGESVVSGDDVEEDLETFERERVTDEALLIEARSG